MTGYIVFAIPALHDNYIWAIGEKNLKNVVIVDPGEAAPVEDFLKQHHFTLSGILITHHHWDHTNGIMELISRWKVPVWGPAQEDVKGVTVPVQEPDVITLTPFSLTSRVLNIPGHTKGHIAYYMKGMLFCGDTLFAAGCGRLFEGSAEQLFSSLQKIAALPDDTDIYCAHEYTLHNLQFAELVEPGNKNIQEKIIRVNEWRKKGLPSLPSTLAEEKNTNPFLRCDSPEVIASVERYADRPLKDKLSVFTWLRKWKDQF